MLLKSPFAPVKAAVATAIAGLTGWWGEADNKLHLMKNNPAISAATVIGDLTEANFGGYAAKAATAAAAVFTDPVTGNTIIRIPDPAGGWAFAATGTPPANSPQDIYGAYVTNAAGDKLLGVAKFSSPITINTAGQLIDVDDVTFVVADPPVGV